MTVFESTTLEVPTFSIKDARHAIMYYQKMAYHRSVVLEGVRRCAMRNRHYWYETAEQLCSETARSPKVRDILDRVKVQQAENADTEFQRIAPMFDATRRESGLEVSDEGGPFSYVHELRRLLESSLTSQILFSIWDVYLCLLYVELEGYELHASSIAGLRCPTIDRILRENAARIDWLKSFRDKLLHPITRITSEGLAEEFVRTLGGSRLSELPFVFTLQRMIDCHLVVVREGIARIRGRDWVASHLSSTPPDTNVMGREQFAGLDTVGSAPNISVLLCICLFRNIMESDNVSSSSPMSVLPERVQSGLSTMLLRSLLLMSERVGAVDVGKLLNSDDPNMLSDSQNVKLLRDGLVPRTLQESNNILAMDRVAVGLLYEPLRVYFQLMRSPGVHDPVSLLEKVPKGNALSALRSFRNVIFHVPRGKMNPDLVEYRWIKIEQVHRPVDILSALLRFFGYSHFCPLDTAWSFPLRSPGASGALGG